MQSNSIEIHRVGGAIGAEITGIDLSASLGRSGSRHHPRTPLPIAAWCSSVTRR